MDYICICIYICLYHTLSIYIFVYIIYIYIIIYIWYYMYIYYWINTTYRNNKHKHKKNTNSDKISIRWSRTTLKEHIKSPAYVSLWWFGEPSISWAIGSWGAQLGTCAQAVRTLGHRHRGDLEKTAAGEFSRVEMGNGEKDGTKQQETIRDLSLKLSWIFFCVFSVVGIKMKCFDKKWPVSNQGQIGIRCLAFSASHHLVREEWFTSWGLHRSRSYLCSFFTSTIWLFNVAIENHHY